MTSHRGIRLKVGAVAVSMVAVIFASLFLVAQPAQASPDDEVMKKALAGAMEMCYRNRGSAFKSPIDTSNYFSVSDVVNAWGSYVMPTDIGNKMGTTPINCKEVFLGVQGGFLNSSTKLQGILARFGKSDYGVTPENLGYVASTGGSNSSYSCVNLAYHLFSSTSDFTAKTSNKVCFPTDSNGKFKIDNPQNVKIEDEGNVTSELGSLRLDYDSSMDCIRYSAMNPPAGESWGQGTGYGCFAWGVDGKTPSEVVQAMNDGASSIVANKGLIGTEGSFSVYQAYETAHTPTASQSTSQSSLSSSMILNDTSSVQTINWLKGGDNGYIGMTFGPDDWAYIYTTYIKRLRESGQISVNNDCTTDKNKYTYAVTSDNGTTWCEVLGAESVTEQFAGQSGNSNKVLELMPFTKILEKYKNLNFSLVDSGTTGGVVGGDDPGTSGGDESGGDATTPTCFNSAGSLGWILCPVLEGLSSVVEGIYDKVIAAQFLEIDASFMAADSSGSVYQGWQDFRNFANIIFAILFLVVILAQVTGIGISNYNVKKILPRLIMTVVLVNVSFLLCQLAVDLSNILGFQLKKMFVDLAGDTVVTVGGFVGNIGSALVSTAVTGGITIGAGIALAFTWEFWLFPLLLFLLGVIISIFFFAIILGVRKAGILILIVLAPVAVVCYTLPNTKKFFDRWFKMFSSLLLVYPICGLLMGGGQYASTLLLGAAGGDDVGFFMALVAMLVQVVPFFLVPSLVKGSLAAMGSLGMKISNFGSRVSGGIQRGIRGSEGVREAERRLSMRNAERSFNRLNRRIQSREDNGRRVGAGLRHRRSAAAARYNRMAYEDIRAGGTQELLAEGTAGRELAERSARSEQMKKDVSAQETIYSNNPELADEQIMGDEYEDALNELMARPTDRAAEVRVQALQNLLSATDAGRSQVQSRMMSVLDNTLRTNPSLLRNGETSGLSVAAAHLNQQHMATYKAKNRGMFSLIGDLSRQQYDMGTQEMLDERGRVITDPTTGEAQRHRFERIAQQDANGNVMRDSRGQEMFRYRSTHYDRSGLTSYTAETLAGADEGAIDRIMESINNGMVGSNDLQSISTTASEALNSDTVRVQPKIAQKLRRIERAGYAASPSTFARATDASLGDVVSRIQSGEISNANGSTELTRLALSAQSALRDPAALHSPETAERLNQILTAAGAQGAVDTATGSRFRAVDSASIKIRGREAPRQRRAAPVPQGWTENGIWVGGGSGPTKRQQIAYEQWARHAADVEIHNAEINNPQPPPPPPNP